MPFVSTLLLFAAQGGAVAVPFVGCASLYSISVRLPPASASLTAAILAHSPVTRQ